jgi:hypothetical protein
MVSCRVSSEDDMSHETNPQGYIEGVYAYCDRWCERCALTDRCRLADHEAKRNAELRRQGRDPQRWDVALDEVGRAFTELAERVRADAEALGVELSEAIEEVGVAAGDGGELDEHPVLVRALAYTKSAHAFLDATQERLRVGSSRGDTKDDDAAVEDALDTVSWYHTMVPAKLARAVEGLIAAQGDPGSAEHEESDANGSAKVAYLGIARSLSAFHALSSLRPWLGPSIMPCMMLLCELRDMVEQHFPGFRSFIRPGFDEASGATKATEPRSTARPRAPGRT